MKLKWTKHCVLSANGNDKVNVDSNIFLLSKDLKDHLLRIYWNDYYTKSENKNTTNE